MRNEVINLHEPLEKFVKVKDKLDLIVSNLRALYNLNDLSYKPNRSFRNICQVRNKSNRLVCKFNIRKNLYHLEPYYYFKLNYLRWSKTNNSRLLKTTNTLRSKKIWSTQYEKLTCFTGMLCNIERAKHKFNNVIQNMCIL